MDQGREAPAAEVVRHGRGRLVALSVLAGCVAVAWLGYTLVLGGHAAEFAVDATAAQAVGNPSFDDLTRAGTEAYASGDLEAAEEAFAAALAIRPEDPVALYNVGVILSARGDQASARDHFAASVAVDPTRADAQFNLGVSSAALGDRQGAEQAYRATLGLRPEDDSASWNLGLLLYEGGRVEEGRAFMLSAIDMNPDLASRLPPDVILTEQGQP